HTDAAEGKAGAYRLGEARAEAVRRYLSKQGVALNRISTISYGADALLAQIAADGLGTSLAQAIGAGLALGRVGVALDLDIDVAIVALQLADEGVQSRLRFGRQGRFAGGELDAVVGKHRRIDELALGEFAGGVGPLQRFARRGVDALDAGFMAVHAGGDHADLFVDEVLGGAAGQARGPQQHSSGDRNFRHVQQHEKSLQMGSFEPQLFPQ
ncbi:MAG: hypothetical protein EON94_07835, partial [Caulobacteraceae bacterium]